MRFIPTKFHAPLDYIVGVALIAAPWIFQFSEHTAPTVTLAVYMSCDEPAPLGLSLVEFELSAQMGWRTLLSKSRPV